jgi:choline dehydrogenase-like flavoprotein
MHDDPRQGVVDRNCKLHEFSSVYVAGGSVFPTGGYANPTLTVVALAIRLADELKGTLTGVITAAGMLCVRADESFSSEVDVAVLF